MPGRAVWLKREDVHELGAFKWRGALPTLELLRAQAPAASRAPAGSARRHCGKAQGAAAVVTASTGNHGAATAWAAERLGLRAVVYAPVTVSRAKLALLEGLGAEIRLAGADLDEAKALAVADAAGRGLPFFEDGAEPAQYGGYAAIGAEIVDQLPEQPAAVVVPVGNGALLGGVGRAVLRRSPRTLRIGVVAAAAPVMADSWEAGRPLEDDRSATFADGLAVRVAIPLAVDALREVATAMLRVSERALARAVGTFADAGIRVEGAAAAGLAALAKPAQAAAATGASAGFARRHRQLKDVEGPIVLVVTGRNIDDALLERARTRPDTFPL